MCAIDRDCCEDDFVFEFCVSSSLVVPGVTKTEEVAGLVVDLQAYISGFITLATQTLEINHHKSIDNCLIRQGDKGQIHDNLSSTDHSRFVPLSFSMGSKGLYIINDNLRYCENLTD